MIVGIGGDRGVEAARSLGVGRDAASVERGAGARICGLLRRVSARQLSQQRLAPHRVRPAATSARARPAMRLGILGRHLEDLLEDAQRALGIAFGQHLLAHRDQRLDLGLAALASLWIGSWARIWSSIVVQLAFGARVVRSATGWPWKIA